MTFASHRFTAFEPGPRLLVLGAVHGNEVCGTVALRRVQQELESGALRIERGTLTLVPVTNPLAYQLRRRHGDRNLNRNLRPTESPREYEDKIANVLCPLLAEHDVLLDLHSFHTPGVPFALIGPRDNTGTLEPFAKAAAEEELALRLGVDRFVEGWLETYARGASNRKARGAEANAEYGVGTTEAMRRYGGIAVTLECGQHDDSQAPEVAYRAVRATLAHLGLVHEPPLTPRNGANTLRLHQVVDRLHPDDRLSRDWQSFDAIERGQLLATRHDGTEVTADRDGWIVFPNPAARVNEEWFYLAEGSERLRR
jgi:uncharacterized protein